MVERSLTTEKAMFFGGNRANLGNLLEDDTGKPFQSLATGKDWKQNLLSLAKGDP